MRRVRDLRRHECLHVRGGPRASTALVTSAEVLHELLHAYIPADRIDTLDAASALARSLTEIWPIEESDVVHARALSDRYRALGARDLIHLACCQRRGVTEIKTFDRALASAFA